MLVRIIEFLQSRMTTPVTGGVFHLVAVCFVLAVSAFLILRFRNADDKALRHMLLVIWILMVVAEAYKQLVFTAGVEEQQVVWDFQWYAFPFQFCSTPLYTLPFAIFLPAGKMRDGFLAFLVTFSLFGGVAVYCFPNDVFIEMIGINIQTMLHHGLQIVAGVYLAVFLRRKLSFRFFLRGLPVFAGLVLTAMILNVGVHSYFAANGISETFNMFFISPYYECTLPVLSAIYSKVPYAAFLPMYFIGFVGVALIVFCLEKGVLRLFSSKENSHAA